MDDTQRFDESEQNPRLIRVELEKAISKLPAEVLAPPGSRYGATLASYLLTLLSQYVGTNPAKPNYGKAWPKHETLAKAAKKDCPETVGRVLRDLGRRGLIGIERRKGGPNGSRSNVYTLCPKRLRSFCPPDDDEAAGAGVTNPAPKPRPTQPVRRRQPGALDDRTIQRTNPKNHPTVGWADEDSDWKDVRRQLRTLGIRRDPVPTMQRNGVRPAAARAACETFAKHRHRWKSSGTLFERLGRLSAADTPTSAGDPKAFPKPTDGGGFSNPTRHPADQGPLSPEVKRLMAEDERQRLERFEKFKAETGESSFDITNPKYRTLA